MAIATTRENTRRMTLRIDAPILARLDEYHKKTDIPKTRIINSALQNYLDEMEEDFADARAGEAAWAEYIASGRKSISQEELAKTLGVDLDS